MEFPTTDAISCAPHPRRILCAEDHAQMAQLVKKVLTRAGHQVVCVVDGRQALECATHERFDVVITDHHMPNLTGLELVTKLRAMGFCGKIVLHTSRLTPGEDAAYRELNVDAILMKPGGILQLPGLVK